MNTSLYPGDQVRARRLEEIAVTLDQDGTLDALPFMPEMVPFCGKPFRVFRRLEKTCVEGYGARLLPNTVILEGVRCDGSAHGGCQRNCALLWKEAWLQPIESGTLEERAPAQIQVPRGPSLRTMTGAGRYFCQSTELGRATTYLFPISFKRCTAEFCAKNVDLRKSIQFLWIPLVVKIKTKLFGLSAVQPVGHSKQTPAEALHLQAGELVEVKAPDEIASTLDRQGRNRGLAFTPQMLPFCRKGYAVKSRVDRAILETTGEMREFKHTVILEEVTCDGHTILGGCSRDVYHLWREIWLRRIDSPPCGSGQTPRRHDAELNS